MRHAPGKQVVLQARRTSTLVKKKEYKVSGDPLCVQTHVTSHVGGPLGQDKHTVRSTPLVLQDMPYKPLVNREEGSLIYRIGNGVSDLRRTQTKHSMKLASKIQLTQKGRLLEEY
jgi:hypothetical protein